MHKVLYLCALMRLLLFFVAGMLWSANGVPLLAQPTADSVDLWLRVPPRDTLAIDLLIERAWSVYEENPDGAARLLETAIEAARRIYAVREEAKAHNAYGAVEEIRGNLTAAKRRYYQALLLRRQLGNPEEVGSTLNNLGVLSEMMGRHDSAIVYHRENLRIQQQRRDTVRMARALFNLAGAYQEAALYNEAQTYLQEARLILEARNDPDGTAKVYTQMGHIRFELGLYREALEWYRRSLSLRREEQEDPMRLAEALRDCANALDEMDSSKTAILYYHQALDLLQKQKDRPGIADVYTNLSDAYKHSGNYPAALQSIQEAIKIHRVLEDETALMEDYNVAGDVHYRMKDYEVSLDYVQKYYAIAQQNNNSKYIQNAYKDFAEVYAARGDYSLAYDFRVRYDEMRFRYINEKMSGDFARKEALFDDQRKQQQIEQQERELRLRDAELARQNADIEKSNTQRNALLGGALALILLVALLFNRNRIRARSNRELAAKNRAIAAEQERADNLLRNILPEKTAHELKLYNKVQPVRYESVTVMFSDFVNFTKVAENLPPEILIESLDMCFQLFDRIIETHGLEKIKTIGDAYMCAGGLPQPNDTHPQDVVRAALTMQEELRKLMDKRQAQGHPVFEMRIGVHTGPVVAGVVGSRKFAYDIWGDTVNVAARLEQGSDTGRVNISETTRQLLGDAFQCTFRGHLPAKNKGAVAMYFVDKAQ
jgi:class 3 adenylate cyclase